MAPLTPPTNRMAPVPARANLAGGGARLSAGIGSRGKEADPAIAVRFHLQLDTKEIGWWNSFEGLGMETAIEQREEGGNNAFVHQLPTRLKYSNVKLSRPINEDSGKVAVWFMNVAKLRPKNQTAVIQAVGGPKDTVIAEWSLQEVVPVRWTGPSFSVDSPKVATETLELAYHGFLSPAAVKGR